MSDGTEASESVEFKELQMAIDMFLSELPEKKRILFLRRYWFLQPVKEIAKDYGITEKQRLCGFPDFVKSCSNICRKRS